MLFHQYQTIASRTCSALAPSTQYCLPMGLASCPEAIYALSEVDWSALRQPPALSTQHRLELRAPPLYVGGGTLWRAFGAAAFIWQLQHAAGGAG